MLRLKEEDLLKEETVNKVEFDGKWYFDMESVAVYIKEDLSDVEGITLPFSGEYRKASTLEAIEKGRKQEPLSDFNKALLKMRDFDKKKED